MRLLVMIMPGSPSPRLYFTSQDDAQLIPALVGQFHWTTYIYELSVGPSQTPNPWGGAYLKDPKVVYPSGYAVDLINYATTQLDGMGKEQVKAEVEKLIQILTDYLHKHLDSIKQEEEHPQTEVIYGT